MNPSSRKSRRDHRACLLAATVVVLLNTGCMSQQLRTTARRATSTLPDLQYQQIVDNLAATASNPGLLPYLAVAGQGTVQVTDNGSSALGLSFSPKALTSSLLSLGATRNVTGTWSLGTITSPEKIRSMQAVYERTILGATEEHEDYAWLNIGCQRDVPRGAAFVGCHDRTYVWVMPEGVPCLSDLTLAIVDIATREDSHAGHIDESGPPHRKGAVLAVPRRNFQVPPSGPVYTPGVP
jgi:hypothetical protein